MNRLSATLVIVLSAALGMMGTYTLGNINLSGYNLSVTAAAGTDAITATGGPTSGSGWGVSGTGGAPNGNGVIGIGTGSGIGVRGSTTGANTGPAVQGTSVLGYGVVADGDTTSPVRAALRVVPQDAEPSGANAVGDMYVTTAGVLKICTSAGTPGTWVSVGAQ